jgi:lysyl-tRNA synthetase class 2
MNLKSAQYRSRLYRDIRTFFDQRSFLEVETPLLARTLIPESSIYNFASFFSSEFHPSGQRYLIPSPEIHMKQLIAQGSGSIYQIAKCFRNNEQIGDLHNPEFTMLEWYEMGADYMDSIEVCRQLIQETAPKQCSEEITGDFRDMSVSEACGRYAHFDLEKAQSIERIREVSASLGLSHPSGPLSWEDEFNRIFLSFVEPELPQDRPLILYDYPHQIRCLAKKKDGEPYRERWELYISGIEIANCYTEMTDTAHITEHYRTEFQAILRDAQRHDRVIPDTDEGFADLFGPSYPACSGTAVGLDRLLMVLYNMNTIEDVILFPFSDTI